MAELSRAEMEARRLEAGELLRGGASPSAVARRFGVSRVSAYRWARRLKGDGLGMRKAPGRPGRLTREQMLQLHALWETRERWSGASFAEAIEQSTGVKFHSDHVLRLMAKMGLRMPAAKSAQMDLAEGESA